MKSKCKWALCGVMLNQGERYCPAHLPKAQEKYKAYVRLYEGKRREYDKTYITFYASKEWKAVRAEVLKANPICSSCKRSFANTAHHIEPIKTNWQRRLDRTNLMAICEKCHTVLENRERNKQRGRR